MKHETKNKFDQIIPCPKNNNTYVCVWVWVCMWSVLVFIFVMPNESEHMGERKKEGNKQKRTKTDNFGV